jgi:hypothetical protein
MYNLEDEDFEKVYQEVSFELKNYSYKEYIKKIIKEESFIIKIKKIAIFIMICYGDENKIEIGRNSFRIMLSIISIHTNIGEQVYAITWVGTLFMKIVKILYEDLEVM